MSNVRTMEQAQEIIQPALNQHALLVKEWRVGDDGPEAVIKGMWVYTEDDEEFDEGDEGTLGAAIAGAPEYHNERVYFWFEVPGRDPAEVDFSMLRSDK